MAENKKGFVLYADQKASFEDLTNEEAGILIKHIFAYVNDEDPVLLDRLLQVAFNPIKQQLKRDLQKYEQVKEKRSKAGLLSAEMKKQNATNSTSVKSVEPLQQDVTNSTVKDNVNVNVKDNVNVNVKGNVINIIEQYFIDFENGTHIIEMARIQKTTPEKLKSFIPFFKLKTNAEYQNYAKFIDHFRNSYLLNKDKINNDTQKGGRVLE